MDEDTPLASDEPATDEPPTLVGDSWKPLLYPVGILVAFGLAVLGASLVTPHALNSDILTATDQFNLWRALVGLMLALSVASLFVTLPLARRVWSQSSKQHRWVLGVSTVASGTAAGVVLFATPALVNSRAAWSPPLLAAIRTGMATVFVIELLFLLPAILILITVAQIAHAITVHLPTDNAVPEPADLDWAVFGKVKELRHVLTSTLMWLAVPVSAVVIVTGQLRNTLVADDASVESDYPVGYLLIYGAMFAAVLGALYLPAYFGLRKRASQLLEATYPYEGSSDWEDDRDRLSDYLGVSAGLFENAKSTFGTLSPVIASVVAFFIPALA